MGAKGRNIGFGRAEWAKALARASLTNEVIARHAVIMDRHDPEKKFALVVDEWGGWFHSEADAPSALYVESMQRDSLIAGISVNVFNPYAD